MSVEIKDRIRIIFITCIVVALTLFTSGCGADRTKDKETSGELEYESLSTDDSDPVVIFDNDNVHIENLEDGTVIREYVGSDYKLTIGKPVIAEEIREAADMYGFKYVRVVQEGGIIREVDDNNGIGAFTIFFPESLTIRACSDANKLRHIDGWVNFDWESGMGDAEDAKIWHYGFTGYDEASVYITDGDLSEGGTSNINHTLYYLKSIYEKNE